MYSNTISIVHSNFRKKEPLYYLFRPHFCNEQTLVLGTYSFLQYFQPKISQALHHEVTQSNCYNTLSHNLWGEIGLRVPLPLIDCRAHSLLLFQYNTGRRRIEWEVWRWISTPGTDESMAALSQTRAAMLWSVKQKYDRQSLRWPFDLFLNLFYSSGYYPLTTIGIYMCCNRVLPPIL